MRKTSRIRALLLVLALVALGMGAATVLPPDSEYNPVYQRIETVDTVLIDGSLEVRHTIDTGVGAPNKSSIISDHPADDTEVRLTVDKDGDSWVVWTRQTEISQIILRKRNGSGGWTSDFLVSEPGEPSFDAEPLHDGESIWITYTLDDGEGLGIAVRSGDGPVPWPMRDVIHVLYDVEITPNPRLHLIEGQLLVTWNESRFELGYSFYDNESESWAAPEYQSHDGDREKALEQITTGLH